MTHPVVLLVAALGAGVWIVLVNRVVTRALRGRELWSAGAGVVLVGSGLLMESQLVGSRSLWQALLLAAVAAVAVAPLLTTYHQDSSDEHVAASRLTLLILALSTTALLVNLVRNPLAPAMEVYSRALAPVFWVLVALVALVGGLARTGFIIGAIASLAALSVLMPVFPAPVGACLVDKCSVFGILLQGPYASENFLSVVAGSVFFLALSLGRDELTVLGALTAGTTLLAAGGRGSMLAAGFGLAVVGLLSTAWARNRVHRLGALRRRLAAFFTTVVFATVALTLMLRANTSDFSRRGNVWRRGLNAVREEWVLGAGLSRWDGYEGVAAVSHHYPHSQYLLVLFSAGLVGLILYAVVMAAILSSALELATRSRAGAWLVGHVAFLLTVGLVEVVFNPLSLDGLSWALMAHLLPLAAGAGPAQDGADRRRTAVRTGTPRV